MTGAITTRPRGRVWWSDRRHADQVYRTEHDYEGELRIIGVRRNLMPELEAVASGAGWRCFVTRDPVSLSDVEVTDWRMT